MANIDNLIQAIENSPDKGLYELTQKGYDFVHNILPEKLHNLTAEVMLEGFVGAYLLTRALQLTSEHVVYKVFPCWHDKILPVLERACEIGIPAALLAYSIINPEGAKELIYNKPMDNLGIFMAYLGGVLAAEQDFSKRRKMRKEQDPT